MVSVVRRRAVIASPMRSPSATSEVSALDRQPLLARARSLLRGAEIGRGLEHRPGAGLDHLRYRRSGQRSEGPGPCPGAEHLGGRQRECFRVSCAGCAVGVFERAAPFRGSWLSMFAERSWSYRRRGWKKGSSRRGFGPRTCCTWLAGWRRSLSSNHRERSRSKSSGSGAVRTGADCQTGHQSWNTIAEGDRSRRLRSPENATGSASPCAAARCVVFRVTCGRTAPGAPPPSRAARRPDRLARSRPGRRCGGSRWSSGPGARSRRAPSSPTRRPRRGTESRPT